MSRGRRTGRPDYRLAARRRRRAIKLYRRGLTPPQIARALGCAPTTVWRYLHDFPKTQVPRAVPHFWPHRRPPYWALHVRGGAGEVVCGRKFCPVCGIWRQLCDFAPESRRRDSRRHGMPHARCRACDRVSRRYYASRETPEQIANRRERHRIYYEGMRRRNGVPISTANRRSVIDRAERVLLPRGPLVAELERRNGSAEALARLAGVPERSIVRLKTGESRRVRIDVADKLAVAMGIPLELIYQGEGVEL